MHQRSVIVGRPGFVLCFRFTVCGQRRGPLRASHGEAVDDAIAAGFGSRERQHPGWPRRPGQVFLHPLAYIARGFVEERRAARLIARGRGAANDGAVGSLARAARRCGDRTHLVEWGRVAVVTWL